MKTKTILFLLFFCVIFSPLCAQQNQKLDSLLALYKTQKEDSIKAELINDIIQIEGYNNPTGGKNYILELITLSKKINYIKGEAKGYNRYGEYFRNRTEIDSAMKYFMKSIKINKSINNIEGILTDNVRIALIYQSQNNFDLAHKFLEKNIDLYKQRDSQKQNDDFQFIGSTYHTLTNLYRQQGMYNLALKSELKAIKLYTLTNDSLYIADALNGLGTIEIELGNHEQALNYYEEAYKIYKKNNDLYFQTLALINMGKAFNYLKNYEEAIVRFRKGIDIAEKAGYKEREAAFWSTLGDSYENIDNVKEAISYQKKSIAIYKQLGNPNGISYPYVNIGNLYRKAKDFTKSKYYLDRVISKVEPEGLIGHAANAYDFRSKLFSDMKKYDLALEDYKMHVKLKDSIFNSTKSKQIEELRTIYDTEKKEQQIVLQEKEITVLEQQKKISTQQKFLLLGTLLLSLFGFYGLRQKMKHNKLQRDKVEAELAFKKKELTTHALHLAKKNEVLESVKQKAKELKMEENGHAYQQLITTINFDQQDDKNWENFTHYFEQVHKNFSSNVNARYPEITKNELRFMALLKMNMSSKEIATILNISTDGIKKARQRLRKKMRLSPEESLENTVMTI